jgi:hypothetical protein
MAFRSTAIGVLVATISGAGCVVRTSQTEIVEERDSVRGEAFRADYGLDCRRKSPFTLERSIR